MSDTSTPNTSLRLVLDPTGATANPADDQVSKAVVDYINPVLERLEGHLSRLTDLLTLQIADWLTVEHAALVCDCSYEHIYRAVQAGDLPAADIGNGERKAAYRIARADLNAWLERNKGGKTLPPRSELKTKKSRYLPGVA